MKSQTYETSKPMIKTKPDFLKKGNKGQSPSVPATLVEKSDLVEDSERFVHTIVEILYTSKINVYAYMYIILHVLMLSYMYM